MLGYLFAAVAGYGVARWLEARDDSTRPVPPIPPPLPPPTRNGSDATLYLPRGQPPGVPKPALDGLETDGTCHAIGVGPAWLKYARADAARLVAAGHSPDDAYDLVLGNGAPQCRGFATPAAAQLRRLVLVSAASSGVGRQRRARWTWGRHAPSVARVLSSPRLHMHR